MYASIQKGYVPKVDSSIIGLIIGSNIYALFLLKLKVMGRSIDEKIIHYQRELSKWRKSKFKPKTPKICGCCGEKISEELYEKRLKIEEERFQYIKNAEIEFCKARLNELGYILANV